VLRRNSLGESVPGMEAEAQKHKAESYFSNFAHFKQAHIFRPCERIFFDVIVIATLLLQRFTRSP